MKKSNDGSFVMVYRIFLQVIRIAPLSSLLALLYRGFEGLFPAYVTFISILLFDAVSHYLQEVGDLVLVQRYGLFLLLGYVIKQVLTYVGSISVNAGVYEKVTKYSSFYLYQKCAHLPLIAYEDAAVLDAKERAMSCVNREMIAQLYMTSSSIIISLVGIFFTMVVLVRYHWLFVLMSFLSVIPYFIVHMIRGKDFYLLSVHQVKEERKKKYLWTLFSSKQALKEMRVMNFSPYLVDKWVKIRDQVNEERWQLLKKDALSLFVCDLIRIGGYASSLFLALFLMLKGEISGAVLGATIAAFASMQRASQSFLVDLGKIPERMQYVREYFHFLDQPNEVDEETLSSELIEQITLQAVDFTYPNRDEKTLNNLHLTINAGDKIALIGENGCGKTTLIKVLLALYPPNNGTILINHKPMSLASRADFLRKTSIISQDFIAYHLTLRENVAISNPMRISESDAIYASLEQLDFPLAELQLDLESMLGREFDGKELSGGQWQKLAIARALFRDSQFMIMDEPTSALDPLSEIEILKKFLAIAQDKTAIIVSHRIGLCTLVDKIAVMKDAHIVEFGTHQDLLKLGGEYARLYQAQSQWYR